MLYDAPSRHWTIIFPLAFVLLVLDISYIQLTGRKLEQTPAIEDVFKKGAGNAASELGTLTSIVPPTAYEAPAPDEHGPQFRTVDWLKGQGGIYWTLQVMSSPDESTVKDYLAARPDRDQFAYFLQKSEGQVVYVVVYGNYVTRELALGVAAGINFNLPEGRQAAPEKFQTFIDNAPAITPAIDAPPAPQYGDVPPVITEETPQSVPSPSASGPASDTLSSPEAGTPADGAAPSSPP